MTEQTKATPLTEEMIDSFPAIDPHVHVPGTISPQTAWELGLRNGLIHTVQNSNPTSQNYGKWEVKDGPNRIGARDPVGKYSRLFIGHGNHPLEFDDHGKPINLDYNYSCIPDRPDIFSGFDAIQGTTQGHRHAPGGIQNENDYRFVMRQYLQSCLNQNIRYTEPSQNISISEIVLYPDLPPDEARKKFFHLAKEIIDDFAKAGVVLRFTHCANKTGVAGVGKPLSERTNDWADWLQDAKETVPGVFVGMTSAGHEKREIEVGGPRAMVDGYQRVVDMGLGVEGHYGEGAGVEHAMKAWDLLPQETRFAHMFQILESMDAIKKVRESGKPIIMSPAINIRLGGILHYTGSEEDRTQRKITHKIQRDPNTGEMLFDEKTIVDPETHEERKIRVPRRVEGIKNHDIENLEEHPIWELMRKHHVPIGLMSDDPQQGGIDYKDQVKLLAGFPLKHVPIPAIPKEGFTHIDREGKEEHYAPLSAEELVLCNLNALQVAFCEPEVKKQLAENIAAWAKEHDIQVEHPLLAKPRTIITGGAARHPLKIDDGRPLT